MTIKVFDKEIYIAEEDISKFAEDVLDTLKESEKL